MNMDVYFKKIEDALEKMSDEEFFLLLDKAGVEECPIEDEVYSFDIKFNSDNSNNKSIKYTYRTLNNYVNCSNVEISSLGILECEKVA